MERLLRWYRVFGYLKLTGALISGASIFAMMLFIVADVVSRNFLSGSISGSFEIVQNYFMPAAVFPALGYVYASGMLPKMELLVPKLREAAQQAVVYFLLVLELVIFAVLAYYTCGYALSGLERREAFPAGGTLYPVWPLFFLVPGGFLLVVAETVFVLVRNLLAAERATLSMSA